MPRWVDVRLVREDAAQAMEALLAVLGPINVSLNTRPPSAAPGVEWELSIEGHSQRRVAGLLAERGISVLAIRERLDATLAIPS